MIRGALTRSAIALMERGWLPDAVVRAGIRRLLRQRLREEEARTDREEFGAGLSSGPVAPVPGKANEQHYEVPAPFFRAVLGPRLKYSACLFEAATSTLADAEEAALARTAERAGLADGMDVLELGCGWGSLTLWMAERYPASRITAVSNSASQREFILDRARERGLGNVRVVTADVNDFAPGGTFDRVVSVEMFEHLRNHRELFRRISTWLRPGGRLFVHVFCHRRFAYPFATAGDSDWMGRHFFTGGMMPSLDLLPGRCEPLVPVAVWEVSGEHYRRTAEAWLANLDARRSEVLGILAGVHGERDGALRLRRWRVFFMACAELFGFRGGEEWMVAHHLFENPSRSAGRREVE